MTTPATAQSHPKTAPEKWRPKEGLYGLDKGIAAPCDSHPLSYVEFSKHRIGADEVYKCDIKKVADAGPGQLRLDANCDDETEGKTKDVITLRRIDDNSFFINWRGKPVSRFTYCRGVDEVDIKGIYIDAETERQRAEASGKWEPRYGVYARPGEDLNDRCMKAPDVTIDFKDISLLAGASRCVVSRVDEQSKNYSRLYVICDRKPNATGVVVRKNGDFVPPGSEKIVMSKTGDQTITLQKSRDGEFSEPAQALTYCPDAAQRSFIESRAR